MSAETTTAVESSEPGAEAWDALAKGTARAQLADALRRPESDDAAADESTTADSSDTDTLSWLLAEAQHRLDNPDGNAEAARHRLARREAETQLAATASRLDAMQRAQIDSQVTALGIKPAALWATAKLDDLLGDDGTPDPAKVQAAAIAAREQLGIIAPRTERGLHSGASAPSQPRNAWDGFRDAVTPKSRREQ